MVGEHLFHIKGVSKSYGYKNVLDNLDFTIEKGEILGLVGKSGSGKSTFMKILANIIKDYQGVIYFHHEHAMHHNFEHAVGFSFQPYSFYPELTLKANLNYFGKIYGLTKEQLQERTKKLFSLTDLDEDDLHVTGNNLSGGMKKRFDIVCSLLHNPDVLILDEPTAGLDPLRRKDILTIIRKINAAGVTVLISSHIMTDIDGVCDRVLLLDNGKIAALASPHDIKAEYLENELILIESEPGNYENIMKTLSTFRIVHCEQEQKTLRIHTPESEILLHFIIHLFEEEGELIQRVVITEPHLGDVFEKIRQEPKEKILKENITKINGFIKELLGKNYDSTKVKEILTTHKWPKEIVDILVNRQLAIQRVKNR